MVLMTADYMHSAIIESIELIDRRSSIGSYTDKIIASTLHFFSVFVALNGLDASRLALMTEWWNH